MKARFQADADLKHAIVNGVRRRVPSIDFQRAGEVPLDGVPDPEVLAIAGETRPDTREPPPESVLGLILIPQIGYPIATAIDGLVPIREVMDPEGLQRSHLPAPEPRFPLSFPLTPPPLQSTAAFGKSVVCCNRCGMDIRAQPNFR